MKNQKGICIHAYTRACTCTPYTTRTVHKHARTYADFHNDCLFLAQKKTILIPNAENKDRTGALWLRNLNLSFFFREKKRQSLWKSE